MAINGTPGNDNLTGTSGDDVFDLSQGGSDTVQGLGGKDIFIFGATFDASDSVDGGTGNDVLRLNGDYSAGVTFGATTLTNVDLIQLTAGHSYNLTTDDATVAAGGSLTIDGHNLGPGDSLTFDGIAEGDGHFHIIGGAGPDDLTGGNGNDVFTLTAGSGNGNVDFASGRAGADTFDMGANLVAADHIDGGTGNDVVDLDGDYTGTHAISFNSVTMTNVEKLLLAGGHSYTFVMNETNVATGKTLTVDASALGASNVLNFNGNPESNGLFHIIGGAGNDRITGGNGGNSGITTFNLGDTYDLSHGGNDTVTGGSGNDTFIMGAALSSHDALDGGDGNDTLTLDGDYSAGLTLGATTIANIQALEVADGNDYSITENNGNLAAGGRMNVSSAVGAGHSFTFNGAAELDGNFAFSVSGGTNTVTGGLQGDRFDASSGLNTFHGSGGNDTFSMGSHFTVADSIDGGAGNDQLTLTGGGTYAFTATTMTNVEALKIGQTATLATYDITTVDANVAAGSTLQVVARGLGDQSAIVVFDGSAETDGHFSFLNNDRHDVFTGGALADSFDMSHRDGFTATGGGGGDTFIANALKGSSFNAGERDIFVYDAVSDSTGATHDSITALRWINTVFDTSGAGAATTGVDAAVTTGALSTATFDANLASDVGAGQMAAHHAVLFTADAGTLSGHTFLVVDENGTAGYQAGADLVIDVTGAFGTLTTANFS